MKYPKPNDYPKLVQVGTSTYHIVFMKKLSFVNAEDMGGFDPSSKLIMISLDQEPDEMFATYWHELLHAFEYETGLKLGHPRIKRLEWFIPQIMAQSNFVLKKGP
jgi:hypothetical protein